MDEFVRAVEATIFASADPLSVEEIQGHAGEGDVDAALRTLSEIYTGRGIELGTKVAEQLGLRLAVNTLSSIGTDFNPRNWSLTRGQCDLIAGGVADTVQTRSFLQTIPTPIETGWVGVSTSGRLPAANPVRPAGFRYGTACGSSSSS